MDHEGQRLIFSAKNGPDLWSMVIDFGGEKPVVSVAWNVSELTADLRHDDSVARLGDKVKFYRHDQSPDKIARSLTSDAA